MIKTAKGLHDRSRKERTYLLSEVRVVDSDAARLHFSLTLSGKKNREAAFGKDRCH